MCFESTGRREWVEGGEFQAEGAGHELEPNGDLFVFIGRERTQDSVGRQGLDR